MKSKGGVIWFTGLPSSGKTTLTSTMRKRMRDTITVEVIDADVFPKMKPSSPGFTIPGRLMVLDQVTYTANLLARNGILVLAAFLTPWDVLRRAVRNDIESEFMLVYLKCSMDCCIRRDTNGLYRRAIERRQRDAMRKLNRICKTYEPPTDADVVLNTETQGIDHCLRAIEDAMSERGWPKWL